MKPLLLTDRCQCGHQAAVHLTTLDGPVRCYSGPGTCGCDRFALRLPTIIEVCFAQGWPLPVSHDDGVAFFRRCLAANIQTNVDECDMAREARRAVIAELRALAETPCDHAGPIPGPHGMGMGCPRLGARELLTRPQYQAGG